MDERWKDTLFTTYSVESIQDLEEWLNMFQKGFPLNMISQDEML